jgi:hypothetical protein
VHDVASQERVRVCVPPQVVAHARLSLSLVPGTHVAPVTHSPRDQSPHAQPALHDRESVRIASLQFPQGTMRVSVELGAHSPSPVQAPSSTQVLPEQTCLCVPQLPHETSRGAAPVSHTHSVGALHSLQTASAH